MRRESRVLANSSVLGNIAVADNDGHRLLICWYEKSTGFGSSGQRWIIGEQRPGAHQNGIRFGPSSVNVTACIRAGDPLA